ncbi:MAG: hypothetical protein GC162_15150 [Planctomycetes bacterium]|nr:hypothetical protein [Planctomycetota bacterium]
MVFSKSAKTHKPTPPAPNAVVFYAYPKLLYIWPLIAIGPLFWLITLAANGDGALEVLAWLYMFAVWLVILTIGVDVERNHGVFWAVILLLFFFIGRALSERHGFKMFFGEIYNWFADMNIKYDRGMGLSMSIMLALPYSVMIFWSRMQHKWRITHNEFEQYSWGRADDSLARGAKRVRTTYPDLLELLLCGAGTLIVYSATGRSELRRIHNVPLLFFVRKRINRLLEQTAVTMDPQHAAALDEAEEVETEAAEGPDDEDSTYEVESTEGGAEAGDASEDRL